MVLVEGFGLRGVGGDTLINNLAIRCHRSHYKTPKQTQISASIESCLNSFGCDLQSGDIGRHSRAVMGGLSGELNRYGFRQNGGRIIPDIWRTQRLRNRSRPVNRSVRLQDICSEESSKPNFLFYQICGTAAVEMLQEIQSSKARVGIISSEFWCWL